MQRMYLGIVFWMCLVGSFIFGDHTSRICRGFVHVFAGVNEPQVLEHDDALELVEELIARLGSQASDRYSGRNPISAFSRDLSPTELGEVHARLLEFGRILRNGVSGAEHLTVLSTPEDIERAFTGIEAVLAAETQALEATERRRRGLWLGNWTIMAGSFGMHALGQLDLAGSVGVALASHLFTLSRTLGHQYQTERLRENVDSLSRFLQAVHEIRSGSGGSEWAFWGINSTEPHPRWINVHNEERVNAIFLRFPNERYRLLLLRDQRQVRQPYLPEAPF